MKFAGWIVGLVGAWLLVTILIGLAVADFSNTNIAAQIMIVAPWTGMAVAGVGLIAAGAHLTERRGN